MNKQKHSLLFLALSVLLVMFTVCHPVSAKAVAKQKTTSEKADKSTSNEEVNAFQGFDLQIQTVVNIEIQPLIFFLIAYYGHPAFSQKNPEIKQWYSLSAHASANDLQQNYVRILPANAP